MGVIAPCRMIRRGDHKYVHTHGHPPQLYDLADDPCELLNRAGDPACSAIEARLRERLLADWDGEAVLQRVLASQRRRLYLKAAAQRSGAPPAWDYQASRDDHQRFVRAHGAAGAKARARYPFVPPT